MSRAVVCRRGGTGSLSVTATLLSSAAFVVDDTATEAGRFAAAEDDDDAPDCASSMSGVEAQDCGRFLSSTLKWTTGLSKRVHQRKQCELQARAQQRTQ